MKLFPDRTKSAKFLINRLKEFVSTIVPCKEMAEMSVDDEEMNTVQVMSHDPNEGKKNDLLQKISSNEGIVISVLIAIIIISFAGNVALVSRVTRSRKTNLQTIKTQTEAPIAMPESSEIGSEHNVEMK